MSCCRIPILIQAEQIMTTKLVDNPGILPFKLGSVKFIKTEHAFLHYYELDRIKDSIRNIEGYLDTYIEYIKSADPIYFSDTSLVINQILISMLETIYDKFNTMYKHPRNKRGLINGLGSIIKSITGNLDHEDALFYSKAINILQNNQNSLKDKYNAGITLNKQILQTFNMTLSTIVSNEFKIHIKLNEIMSNVNMTNFRLSDFIKINSLFNLLKINLQNILNCITSLENALSFSKLSVTHHSVISSQNINFMFNILRNQYEPSELLVHENTEIRDYYDIIECGSYYVDNVIVFVLKFPIMHLDTFTYYHLFSTPTFNNTILIPPKPYLAMNSNNYHYMDGECKRFQEIYYCPEVDLIATSKPNDCIYQLILKQEICSSCSLVQFKAGTEIIQKLDDFHYILSFIKETRIEYRCDREEYQSLLGTYLFEVPEGCTVSTKLNHIKNYKNLIKGTPIKLLSFPVFKINIENKDKPLLLENVPLEQINKLQNLIEKENILNLDALQDKSYHYWTVPIYTVLCIIGLVAGILYLKKGHKRNQETSVTQATDGGRTQPFFLGEERASN